MSHAFLAQLPPIAQTSTLGWVRDDVAQWYMKHLLQRVEVLLPSRGWRVGVLKEFYPRGASLLGLNVNRGSEVCVRFRVPGDKHQFLPFHEVVCTTLHELAHCEISPHNAAFWNLYYELVRECEALEVRLIAQGVPIYPPHVSDPATLVRRQADTGGSGPGATSVQRPRPKAPPRKPSGGKGHVLGSGGSGTATRSAGGGSRTVTQRAPRRPKAMENDNPPADGEGSTTFRGPGHRLGGDKGGTSSGDAGLSPEEMRRRVAEAAARRFQQQTKAPTRPPVAPPLPVVPQDSFADTGSVSSVQDDPATDMDDEEEGEMAAAQHCPPRLSLSQVAVSVAGVLPDNDHVATTDEAVDSNGRSSLDTTTTETNGWGSGHWRCERCHHVNSHDASLCALCSDAVEDDTSESVSVAVSMPPAKHPRLEGSSAALPITISESDEDI